MNAYCYGNCHKCSSPIAIPGLEAYLCDRCGWVARQKVHNRTNLNPQPAAVISFIKPEPVQTILDLK